jgi:hypothetical protein
MRWVQELVYTHLLKGQGESAPAQQITVGTTSLTPSTSSSSSPPVSTRASFSKSTLDALWAAWVSRGGAAEVLAAWSTIRSQPLLPSSATDGPVLTGRSVDAFLEGLMRREQKGRDAVQPLTEEQIVDAAAMLLKHVAQHRLTLSPAQVQRLSVDVPLRLAELRGTERRDAMQSTFAGGSRPLRTFAAANGLPDRLVSAALENGSVVSSESSRQALLDALEESSAGALAVDSVTPSALRAHVIASQLRDLNRAVSDSGVDASIERLERILQANPTSASSSASV